MQAAKRDYMEICKQQSEIECAQFKFALLLAYFHATAIEVANLFLDQSIG